MTQQKQIITNSMRRFYKSAFKKANISSKQIIVKYTNKSDICIFLDFKKLVTKNSIVLHCFPSFA